MEFFCKISPAMPKKEVPSAFCGRHIVLTNRLFLGGSANGAGLGAGTAIDALGGVDFVFAVAFGNRLNGAFSLARAAADARIADLISHFVAPPLILNA